MKEKCLIIETHSDDSCISSAGFINKFSEKYDFYFQLLTCSSIKLRHLNKVVSAEDRLEEYKNYVFSMDGIFMNDPLVEKEYCPKDLDTKMDSVPQSSIVKLIEWSVNELKPDALIIQGPSFHSDHEITYKAGIAALRPCGGFYPKLILVAENPTYVHTSHFNLDLKSNFYVSLTEEEINNKIELFTRCFPSQVRTSENYLSDAGIKDWARYRGIEARCKYAEAFHQFSYLC